jgi:hypothetical protein
MSPRTDRAAHHLFASGAEISQPLSAAALSDCGGRSGLVHYGPVIDAR